MREQQGGNFISEAELFLLNAQEKFALKKGTVCQNGWIQNETVLF